MRVKKAIIGSAVVGVVLITGLTMMGCSSISSSVYDDSEVQNYTAFPLNQIHCMSQTDERLKTMSERDKNNAKITMVEAKYFAITEKYNCMFVDVNGVESFKFLIQTPHGHWMDFEVDPLNMADSFSDLSDDFDVDDWAATYDSRRGKTNWGDLPNDRKVKEDGQFYKDVLKEISEELSEVESQPDIGLISLQFIGRSNHVDSAKFSYDVKNLVNNINASENTTVPDTSGEQQNSY